MFGVTGSTLVNGKSTPQSAMLSGELHAWKINDQNYGWDFKSATSPGKIVYEHVVNGLASSEHSLASPFATGYSNPQALFIRDVPTHIDWGLVDLHV